MRIALISDIHANLPALKAVRDDIRTKGADQIIFLGDAATLGPFPKETLEFLEAWNCECIMGNHDAAMLDPARAMDLQISPPLIPSLEWGVSQLSKAELDFLRSFLPTYQLDLDQNMRMLCYHGSPRSNTDLVLATTPEQTITRLFAGQTANLLVGGHTHVQMLRQRGEQIILNPGSVGSAFLAPFVPGGDPPTLLPWAEYAIIRVEKGGWNADIHRVQFDVDAVQRAIDQSSNPFHEQWPT